MPITKRVMVKMGVEFERKSLNFIKTESDATTNVRLKMEEADMIVYQPDNRPLEYRWYYYDLVSVTVHLVLTVVLMAPMLAYIVFRQTIHAGLSVRPREHFLVL